MTKTIRRAQSRGHFDHGWLDTWHSFSFGDYMDPSHMGFSALRVINEDRIAPGAGFPTHPHRNMEIVTYILSGALAHRDSMGNSSVIRRGEIQKMSAGSGITHSEFNASKTEPVHLLQIWILPECNGIDPGYQQIALSPQEREGRMRLVAAPQAGEGVIGLRQDARIHLLELPDGAVEEVPLRPDRAFYLQVAQGEVRVDGDRLSAGDAIALRGASGIRIEGINSAELLLFDLP